jgi:hypothetical protein
MNLLYKPKKAHSSCCVENLEASISQQNKVSRNEDVKNGGSPASNNKR